jgi:hypothetical protein
MQNILRLPLCQGTFSESKNHAVQEKNLEELSVAKAKETLRKMLLPSKEAVQVFSNLEQLREAVRIFNERKPKEQLPANITETPKFHEVKTESVELSASSKETFARIGEKAREAFIEEQIERANLYNIPYEAYGNNYYQLMVDIDKYEYLLERAKYYSVDWDISEYDPVALEQEIDAAEHNSYLQNQEIHFYFSTTRGVEV